MPTKAFESFKRSLDRAEALLEAHKVVTKAKGRPPWFLSDILRAALVFALSSFDSYIHDVIYENVYLLISKQRGKNLNKKLVEALRECIPYEKAFEILFEEKIAVKIGTAIRKRNADKTFMKPEKTEDALRILNIDDIWKEVARKLRRRKDGLKKEFEKYAKRRDKIVHEGDVGKATRSKGKLTSIRRPYVEKCLFDIDKIVNVIDQIIELRING